MALFEAHGIHKRFGHQVVLEHIDFRFEAGCLSGIMGPNGAGKTTCFNVLTGRFRPDRGRVVLDGEDITGLSPTPAIDVPAELANLFDVRDKVALIPGGYGGIGEAVAWALALGGAHVTVGGRSAEKAQRLAVALSDHGLSAEGIALDAESVASIRNAVARVAERHGRIDILVNCVGIQREEPLPEVTEHIYT